MANDRAPVWPNNHHPHCERPRENGERERNEGQVEFPRSERATRELIKLNFMFLEKQDNYAPTFTQLAFNTCTQTLIFGRSAQYCIRNSLLSIVHLNVISRRLFSN